MALNKNSIRNVVSGITTSEPPVTPAAETPEPQEAAPPIQAAAQAKETAPTREKKEPEEPKRFGLRGRPKGRKDNAPGGNGRKVKVNLALSETLVNDLYEWALEERINPGEMFERALKPFHERETKRRNSGKE